MNIKTHVKLSIALEILVMDFGLTVRKGVGEVPKEIVIVDPTTTEVKGFIIIQGTANDLYIGRKDLEVFAI